jgi:fructose-1,6-bisphosphatase-3
MSNPAPDSLEYLKLLAQEYPSIRAASSEIINLSASLHLPKGTEHFLSDIHGEYEAFAHVLKSGSGSIKRKIDQLFEGELDDLERQELAVLIYYPRQRLSLVLKSEPEAAVWYQDTLFRLVRLCRAVSTKYSRSALREALPGDFANIIEELLHENEGVENKLEYYQSILDTIISIGSAGEFVVALSELIQRLEIAHLHILGDVYDRSPGAHLIMDALLDYHSVDFTWGNHDIVWMGAAAGGEACIASVIRISLRYSNLETLENGYAISLLPLASFAMQAYAGDPCEGFMPRVVGENPYTENEMRLMGQMHKAIAIIQLKLEAQIILRRPQFHMQERLLLDKIDLKRGMVCLDGEDYPLLDSQFPTLDPEHPFDLTPEEQNVIDKLKLSFLNSGRLARHLRFLLSKGGMYRIYNGNLLYHGCIPMLGDGSFARFREGGETYQARSFMDYLDRLVRQGCLGTDPEKKLAGLDAIWYLWSGAQSPLFGKHKMATFERYFIADKTTHQERMNPYYDWRDQEETARRILAEFDLDPDQAHIINGHVPVKVKKGENPVKAGGRLLVIDGGFSKAYQEKTGIAGYTLISNSYGLLLVSHQPFQTTQKAIETASGMHSRAEILETNTERIRVCDTDQGREILERIGWLKRLLNAYRSGLIHEA